VGELSALPRPPSCAFKGDYFKGTEAERELKGEEGKGRWVGGKGRDGWRERPYALHVSYS